jgi:hypothetical protein
MGQFPLLSQLFTSNDGKNFHIHLDKDETPKVVVVVGIKDKKIQIFTTKT